MLYKNPVVEFCSLTENPVPLRNWLLTCPCISPISCCMQSGKSLASCYTCAPGWAELGSAADFLNFSSLLFHNLYARKSNARLLCSDIYTLTQCIWFMQDTYAHYMTWYGTYLQFATPQVNPPFVCS